MFVLGPTFDVREVITMPTACGCGATKCLECVLDCPGCHDSIEDHIEEKKEGVSCQI